MGGIEGGTTNEEHALAKRTQIKSNKRERERAKKERQRKKSERRAQRAAEKSEDDSADLPVVNGSPGPEES